MNCYFCANIPAPPGVVALNEMESRHAAAARRQRIGDGISLIDGSGTQASGIIQTIDRASVQVQIEARSRIEERQPRVTIASSLPKGDRLKVMLEMLSQLGLHEFVPLDCERSIVKPAAVHVARWSRICIEACKQSHNPFVPTIKPLERPVEFVREKRQEDAHTWIADPEGRKLTLQRGINPVAFCIGPEGGFTYKEKSEMIALGAQPGCLGPNILRIETAAVIALNSVVAAGHGGR